MLRLLAILLVLSTPPAARAETLRVLTSTDLAPMARGPHADPPGFHHELITLLAERAGLELELVYQPWERAQRTAAEEPGWYLLAPTRNARREPLYDWVLPVLDVQRVFLTTGERVDGIEEARGLGRIAARGSYQRTLEAEGFERIEVAETDNALRMLAAGRVDAVFTLRERAVFVWAELGHAREDLVVGAPIAEVALWLATERGGDPEIAERLRAAMEAVRTEGAHDALRARYFGGG